MGGSNNICVKYALEILIYSGFVITFFITDSVESNLL